MIAIDWGTTSFRAYLLDEKGAIAERRTAPRGILSVEDGHFAEALEREIGDWHKRDAGPILMSGMIGSRQGWQEVPYLDCPAGLDAIANACGDVSWGEGRRARIVPGLTCRDRYGVPDVMRGEETQIIGAGEALGGATTICLPGTHSKFAHLGEGGIEGFETFMTGEVFAVLWRHSILGRLGSTDRVADYTAFDRGVDRSAEGQGLLHHIFGVRTRSLVDAMPAESLASYLSGILIGHEIRASGAAGPVAVIGAEELTALYHRAFTRCGIESRVIAGEPAARGLWRIAERMGAAA